LLQLPSEGGPLSLPEGSGKSCRRGQEDRAVATDPSDANKSDAKLRKIDMSNVRDVMVAYEQPSQNGKVRANITAIANNTANIAEILNWIERIRDAVEDAEPLIILDVAASDTRNTPISLLEEAFSIYGDKHSLDSAT
jgi:hypothetical protein